MELVSLVLCQQSLSLSSGRFFMSMSDPFSSVWIFTRVNSPSSTFSRSQWYLLCICLVREYYVAFFVKRMVHWLSQWSLESKINTGKKRWTKEEGRWSRVEEAVRLGQAQTVENGSRQCGSANNNLVMKNDMCKIRIKIHKEREWEWERVSGTKSLSIHRKGNNYNSSYNNLYQVTLYSD